MVRNKIAVIVLLSVLVLSLVGCNTSPGRTLGSMWVAHNSTTAVVNELGSGDSPTLTLNDLREFKSYQGPVLEGLNQATEDFENGEDVDVVRMLEYIDPMLDRMLELSQNGGGK